jgi:hypothetical protein
VQTNAINANASTVQEANQLNYAENIQSMQDNVLMSQLNDQTTEALNANATELAGQQNQNATLVQLGQQQADVQTAGLTDATTIASQQQQDQYNLSSTVLGAVTAAGLNHGTESLSSSLTADIAAALGEQSTATAATQSSAQGAIASAAEGASITNSLTKGAVDALGALFA